MNTEKEKVRQLLMKGKEKGSLSYEEIMDSLATTELSPEQIDDIYEQISAMGIKLVHDTTPSLDELDNIDMGYARNSHCNRNPDHYSAP